MLPLLALAVAVNFLPYSALAINYCPPLGPVFPKLTALSTEPSLRAVAANFTAHLGSIPGLPANTTSFSVSIFSAHEASPIYEYHQTAPLLNASSASGKGAGVAKVDADTVFRIGSVSKVFVVLELLLHSDKVHFDDPVTKYVPELAALAASQNGSGHGARIDVEEPEWSDITVGSLASFLAGIGRDYTFGDLTTRDLPWAALGFPSLNASSGVPTCGGTDAQAACSRKDFFANFPSRHPAYASYTTPVYSNIAFWILGYVVETVTSKSYDAALREDIFGPLGMKHSSVLKPEKSTEGLIPVGDSGWDYDLGGEAAAGGIYSTTNDLVAFCKAILAPQNCGLKLSPAAMRAWLKPASNTASAKYAVGAPWEIHRPTSLTRDGRIIDMYTKAGGVGEYVSYIVLLPDYDVAMTVLIAGPNTQLNPLPEAILEAFIPAIDEASRAAAMEKYVGTYSANGGSSTINVTVDSGPGLKVTAWHSNGADILQEYGALEPAGGKVDMRLYPTGLISTATAAASSSEGTTVGRQQQQQEAFRALFQDAADEGSLLSGCSSWEDIDGFVYGGRALDDFVFRVGPDGKVASLETRVMRQVLAKQG